MLERMISRNDPDGTKPNNALVDGKSTQDGLEGIRKTIDYLKN